VLLGIQPWNFPLYQVVRFASPNLVAGNTVLLKHAEVCPQTALTPEQLFADARAPDGVYTNVFLSIPMVVIPAGIDANGVPFGIQVIARRWHDERLLAIAEAIGAVTGGFGASPGF
jgi:Asp-tRNA(Asn)/Glu-tRNA(Gln) amidotransferase A subunit family amidase